VSFPDARLPEASDVFDRVHGADRARDGQTRIQLHVEFCRCLGSGPWFHCPNDQAQHGNEGSIPFTRSKSYNYLTRSDMYEELGRRFGVLHNKCITRSPRSFFGFPGHFGGPYPVPR
jgi:hypothetical protein